MTPVYIQIADNIDKNIINGIYPAGSRLKSERDLAAELDVARGTIKRAYAELCKRGHITMVRGSGVYVSKNLLTKDTHSISSGLYKMLIQLQSLDLSHSEIDEIVREAFWQRLKHDEKLHITWIDCSQEIINRVGIQISNYCNVHTSVYTIDDVVKNPSLVDLSTTDMLVTTIMHFDELCMAIPSSEALFSLRREMVSLSFTTKTLRGLAKIKPHHRTAVVYQSEPYKISVDMFMQDFGVSSNCDFIKLDSNVPTLIDNIKNYDCVVLPQNFEQYSSILTALKELCLSNNIEVIDFEYVADAGSLLRLKKKIQELWLSRANRD